MGMVMGVGSEVADFTKRDRVISQGWHEEEAKVFHGTFQQFLPVPTYLASKISTSIPFDEAAPFFSCLVTAAISMYCQKPGVQSLKLSAPWAGGQGAYTGKSLFIVGGAGNVGQFVIQFAKWSGFGRIITTASPRNQDLLRSFGATHVINRVLPADKIVEDIEAIANGPVGIVYDAVSEKSTLQLATAALHHGIQLVLVLPGAELAIKDVVKENKIQIVSAMGRMSGVNQDALASFWDNLPECLEKGLIKPVPYEVLPGGLSTIPARLEHLRNDQVSALKLVVLPANTE